MLTLPGNWGVSPSDSPPRKTVGCDLHDTLLVAGAVVDLNVMKALIDYKIKGWDVRIFTPCMVTGMNGELSLDNASKIVKGTLPFNEAALKGLNQQGLLLMGLLDAMRDKGLSAQDAEAHALYNILKIEPKFDGDGNWRDLRFDVVIANLNPDFWCIYKKWISMDELLAASRSNEAPLAGGKGQAPAPQAV